MLMHNPFKDAFVVRFNWTCHMARMDLKVIIAFAKQVLDTENLERIFNIKFQCQSI